MAYNESDMRYVKQKGISQIIAFLEKNPDVALTRKKGGQGWALVNLMGLSERDGTMTYYQEVSEGKDASSLMCSLAISEL